MEYTDSLVSTLLNSPEQTKRYRSILDKRFDSIVVVDKELRLLKVERYCDSLYEELSKKGIGKRPEDYFEESIAVDYDDYKKAINKCLVRQCTVEFFYHTSYKSEVFYYCGHAVPFNDELAIVFVQHISYQREQEKRITALQDMIHLILDHLPMGVYLKDIDDDFRYLYWNQFMEEMTGIESVQIVGKNDADFRYNALISAEKRLYLVYYSAKSGEMVECRGKIKTPSGERRNIEMTKYPISLSGGTPLLLVLWRDITQNIATEDTLKKTRILANLSLSLADVRTCSILIHPESAGINYDDSEVQMFSHSVYSEEMRSLPWPVFRSRIHPEDVPLYEGNFLALCRGVTREVKIQSRHLVLGTNDYQWRETSAFVYEKDEKGRTTVILGCSINIQERMEKEQSLSEAKSKAETADLLKSKYLANMSHEIRTPLNAITGFSELLAFADSEEERKEYYQIIKDNNILLMQLVNDILDMSKIEADVIKITYSIVNLNELLQNIYLSAKFRMPENVQLILNMSDVSCSFITDYIRLTQLINNLLNNAIKNTKQGSITFGYQQQGDRMRFYVQDTGIGISENKLSTIFGRYVKINDYVEGIGLGLAISHGLVTKMGGEIFVDSKLGKGSVFSFTLPIRTSLEI